MPVSLKNEDQKVARIANLDRGQHLFVGDI